MRKLIVLSILVVSALSIMGCSKEPEADMTPPKGAETATPAQASPGGGGGGGTPTAATPSAE